MAIISVVSTVLGVMCRNLLEPAHNWRPFQAKFQRSYTFYWAAKHEGCFVAVSTTSLFTTSLFYVVTCQGSDV